ncbi:uncharacterized protein LOC127839637 [Dreissena polymorpha]|uniref:uncharacterized protein LOC127839637 n=1 Tax=Dreissena polymorpha TaxID=45954 RepID=UPI0022656B11|nr:uncharacterized protein LOC127839637 [Dreissena polymorpha]
MKILRLLLILAKLTLSCMQTCDPTPDPCAKQNNTAYERVKESLHSVKVCKYDATETERQLKGELVDHWNEKTDIVKQTKIPISDLPKFLDHLHDAYEGIDEGTRKKMNSVFFAKGGWEHKLMEWKMVKGDDAVARYGMIAFGRSPDKEFVDCMFVIYKLDFKVLCIHVLSIILPRHVTCFLYTKKKNYCWLLPRYTNIAPKVIVTENKHSMFFDFIKWTIHTQETEEQTLGVRTIKAFQNFVRSKALKGFVEEGLIEQINYVGSLDEIPDA